MTTTPLPFIRGRKARTEALPRQPKPDWLKVRAPGSENYHRLKGIMRSLNLHTVCEEANCPNIGECWHHGTATFMILGDTCTRSCGYCNVVHGTPNAPDADEPVKVASAIHALELSYVVVTSVDRDDLPDFGATHFAQTIRETRARIPACRLEVLIPDFQGDERALRIVLDARPDVLNHNIETVPRIFRRFRPRAGYRQSLELLARARALGGPAASLMPKRVCPFIETRRGYDAVMECISKNLRANLRKASRKLEEGGGVRFTSETGLPHDDPAARDRMRAAYEIFLAIEASGWKGREGTGSAIALNAPERAFYAALIDSASPSFLPEIEILWQGERPLAAQYSLQVNGIKHALKAAYDEEQKRNSPGHVLLAHIVETACARGLSTSGPPSRYLPVRKPFASP